jgi:hypothetical protein
MGEKPVVEGAHGRMFAIAVGVVGVARFVERPRLCPQRPKPVGEQRGARAVDAEDQGEGACMSFCRSRSLYQ